MEKGPLRERRVHDGIRSWPLLPRLRTVEKDGAEGGSVASKGSREGTVERDVTSVGWSWHQDWKEEPIVKNRYL